MLSITLYIMGPMQLQSLKLLHLTVGLEGDSFTRNMKDGTDWYNINIIFFQKNIGYLKTGAERGFERTP